MTQSTETARMEARFAPDWAWDTIMETLSMDCNSKAFDPALRQDIRNALDAVESRDVSDDRMLDAMIVWECIPDRFEAGEFYDAFKAYGVSEMRSEVVGLVEPCREAFQLAVACGYQDIFDIEFVTWFVETCLIETPSLQIVANVDARVRTAFSKR